MKRFISILMVLAIVVFAPLAVFADESALHTNGEVVIEGVPEEVMELAKKEIPACLESLNNYLGTQTNRHIYSMGSPIITYSKEEQTEFYDFPVMEDGIIIGIFSIWESNNEMYYQMGEYDIAEQLQIMKKNGILKTAQFYLDDSGLFAMTKKGIVTVCIEGDLRFSDKLRISKNLAVNNSVSAETDIVDVSEPLISFSLRDTYSLQATSRGVCLNVKSVPQTTNNKFGGPERSWCGAAVSAAIINYKKGTSLTAKSVTTEALGTAQDKGLTMTQIINVARKHGLFPKSGNPLSYSAVKSQINAKMPVHMHMQRKSGDGKIYHALGLIGYDNTYYTAINPWFKTPVTFPQKDKGANVEYKYKAKVYKWNKSIYNWR